MTGISRTYSLVAVQQRHYAAPLKARCPLASTTLGPQTFDCLTRTKSFKPIVPASHASNDALDGNILLCVAAGWIRNHDSPDW